VFSFRHGIPLFPARAITRHVPVVELKSEDPLCSKHSCDRCCFCSFSRRFSLIFGSARSWFVAYPRFFIRSTNSRPAFSDSFSIHQLALFRSFRISSKFFAGFCFLLLSFFFLRDSSPPSPFFHQVFLLGDSFLSCSRIRCRFLWCSSACGHKQPSPQLSSPGTIFLECSVFFAKPLFPSFLFHAFKLAY